MRAAFALNYVTNLFRGQYRGIMRYSGEYSMMAFVLGLIWFDHHLELRIRKDMNRVILMHRTLYSL